MQSDTATSTRQHTTHLTDQVRFYQRIGRPDLSKKLSHQHPYVYWTMELYDAELGLKGSGGLGVLAADTRRLAEQLSVPFVAVTPFYQSEKHQRIENLSQHETDQPRSPDDYQFDQIGEVTITTQDMPDTTLSVFAKHCGATRCLTITEPHFGQLYEGAGSSDHRLYQEVALGFGGYKALQLIDVKPAVIQLNETATVFAALARLDELCCGGVDLPQAITTVRAHTLYTNHTLLQAAEPEFHLSQFERFVLPNLHSQAVRDWVMAQFRTETLPLNNLAIALAEAKNAVSRLHARLARFHDREDQPVTFRPITNGIDLTRWVLPATRQLYRQRGIIDEYDLPGPSFSTAIRHLKVADIRLLKHQGRQLLTQLLRQRHDQYQHAVTIPDTALLFSFRRRFASYKRPQMIFGQPDMLARFLQTHDAHYILTGSVHPGDTAMYQQLEDILQTIDRHAILRQRVHYIQDYDEPLGQALSVGSDVTINLPIVGWEACGTSWQKDIANLAILISTNDGGVADVQPASCLIVGGHDEPAELTSLYHNLWYAATILRDDQLYEQHLQEQLRAYLPIISGTRMFRDYLEVVFPTH